MKTGIMLGIVLLLMISAPLSAQTPVGTAFTYQGQLKSGGAPYTGTADMQFTLYDAAVAGNIVAGPIASGNVQVVSGLFTTTLDFGGGAFNGDARWLETAVVTPAGGGAYTPLNPRQAVRPAPYALKVPGIDGHSLDTVDGSIVDALFVNGAGNVGIGTQNPLAALHIMGNSGNADLLLKRYGAAQGFELYVDSIPRLCVARSDGTSFYNMLVVDGSTGYVGIGSSWPVYPLTVVTSEERAIYGLCTAANGGIGVSGCATGVNSYGFYGQATATSGVNCGGYFTADSTDGRGVYGSAIASSGPTCGVMGVSQSPYGHGVYGVNSATSGPSYGGYFETSSPAGRGVYGWAPANGGIAGYFENDSGSTAPALQTIGDALVQAQNWPGGGTESRLYLGDGNHYIKSVAGQGVRIGTYGGVDLVRLQEGVGLVGIARTPTANKLEVEGSASKSAAGDWLANSDARIKTDIQTVANALDTLDKVRLVSFRYTDEYRCEHPGIADRQYVNVIAQEFAVVFPDYVQASGEKLADGDEILQVDPYPLTVYSAAAVQELHAIVKEKEAQIAAQQAEIDELSARLARVEQLLGTMVTEQKGDAR